jgi:MFS transporter, PAT family, solute carrier family 33 (acetyl-CoA transportor), member 1
MSAYKIRTTLVPFVDMMMLFALRKSGGGIISGSSSSSSSGTYILWGLIIVSTILQTIVSSLQFNAQMTFFAKRVDPAIGGSYMTLLNTAANLGGTWPASVTMWLVSKLGNPQQQQDQQKCTIDPVTGKESCITTSKEQQQHLLLGHDPFFRLQVLFSILGCLWIVFMSKRVQQLSDLPDDAWRTQLSFNSTKYNNSNNITILNSHDLNFNDIELGGDSNTSNSFHTFHKIHPE